MKKGFLLGLSCLFVVSVSKGNFTMTGFGCIDPKTRTKINNFLVGTGS